MARTLIRAAATLSAIAATPAMAASCEVLLPSKVSAASARPIVADDLVGLRDLAGIALSPDGRSIAFELHRGDAHTNGYCIGLFVLTLGRSPSLVRIDQGAEPLISHATNFGLIDYPFGSWLTNRPAWSPDGHWVAYLKRVDGVDQLWRATKDGQAARVVVSAPVDVLEFAWTPDSRGLIFSSRPGLQRFRASVAEEARLGFLYDDRFAPGLSKQPMPRDIPIEVMRVDVSSGATSNATDAEVALVRPAPPGDVHGASAWSRSAQGRLAWSAARSGVDDSLHAMLDGRRVDCPAETCQGGITDIWWKGERTIQYLRREGWGRSRTAFYSWIIGERAPRRLFGTDYMLQGCEPGPDDIICLHEAATTPRRIVAISRVTGRMRLVFDPNPEFRNIALQPARRYYWKNSLGLEAYGDLILPVGHQPGQKHPLIVVGYNGARNFHRGGVGDEYPIQLFASRGFAVLSYARPELLSEVLGRSDEDAAMRANLAGWADRRSVQSSLDAGLDAVIATGTIDPGRIGITGLSDAAMTAQWALLNSKRFAAASVSSLNSRVGFLAIGGPARATLFRAWGLVGSPLPESIAFWAPASLAENPDRLTAPLLVQVADAELLSGVDSIETLRALGKPVEIHVFPNEYHNKWQPSHRLALYQRNLQWFDFWLMNRRDDDPVDPEQYGRWEAMRDRSRQDAKARSSPDGHP